jgi:hypothetical protein
VLCDSADPSIIFCLAFGLCNISISRWASDAVCPRQMKGSHIKTKRTKEGLEGRVSIPCIEWKWFSRVPQHATAFCFAFVSVSSFALLLSIYAAGPLSFPSHATTHLECYHRVYPCLLCFNSRPTFCRNSRVCAVVCQRHTTPPPYS